MGTWHLNQSTLDAVVPSPILAQSLMIRALAFSQLDFPLDFLLFDCVNSRSTVSQEVVFDLLV